jgi:mono/diheme cytochrome c family protein
MFLNGMRPAATGSDPVALNPAMPYYVFHNMDADDADAIVAYLRTIKPVAHSLPPRPMLFNVTMPATYLTDAQIPMPRTDAPNQASAMHGRYLAAKSGLCIECHTQHNPPGSAEPLTNKYFQGGEMFPLFPGVASTSANLTSDVATGLGNWGVPDILKVLNQGIDKDGKGICPPMPVGPDGYGGMAYQDQQDVANYIKSLPAATNQVMDMCSTPFPAPPSGDGGMMMTPVDGGGTPDSGATPDASADGSSSNPG